MSNLYRALPLFLSLLAILGLGIGSPATAKPRKPQCVIVEVTCRGDATAIKAEIPLKRDKNTGYGGSGGSGSSFYEGAKTASTYDHTMSLHDVHKNHLMVNVMARSQLVGIAGKVLADNSVSTDIKVVRGKTNEYHFDKGIAIKAYFAECKEAPEK